MAGAVDLLEGNESRGHLVVDPSNPIAACFQLEERVPGRCHGGLDQRLGHRAAGPCGALGDAPAGHVFAGVHVDDAYPVDRVPQPDVVKHLREPPAVAQGAVHPDVLLSAQCSLLTDLLDVGALQMRQRSRIEAPRGVAPPLRHQRLEGVRVYAHDVFDGEVARPAQLLEGVALAASHGPTREDDPRPRLGVVPRGGEAHNVVLPLLPLSDVVVVVGVVALRRRLPTLPLVRILPERLKGGQPVVGACGLLVVVALRGLEPLRSHARINLDHDCEQCLILQASFAKCLVHHLAGAR
mmetsp:Transcript_165154/g.530064  ORF Transcript_165154/g.530064 Transcript_165154/m.530064 type:complete len:296 (-) Transcript_165154:550-1437(-)